MTSSAERRVAPQTLPPALASMWRLCRLGYRHEPGLIVRAFLISLAAALPDALLAYWFKLLGEGALAGDWRRVRTAMVALGLSATATWFLMTVSTRVQRRFRDRVTIALESHIATMMASITTIAHQERPVYLDRLAVLRHQVFMLDHMYMSLFTTCGWLLRLGVTIALLMSIHPALALLALFAIPPVFTSSWRPEAEQRARERGAASARLARHLFDVSTTAAPGKDVRVLGIGARLGAERQQAWRRGHEPIAAARRATAAWHAAAWALFGAGYVAAVIFVVSGLAAPPGDVLLALAAGSRLSAYVGATVGEIGFLRGVWLDAARRLAWLEDYAAAEDAPADAAAPAGLVTGIRFDDVSFAYPGTDRLVLDGVTLDLPAGATVAIVGENGAGKSTLVKLLGKLYAPTSGRVLVDGVDLARIPAPEWRRRLAGAFQDFFKFELTAGRSVGVGDLPRLDDDEAVRTALARAGADPLVGQLARGLQTQLGPTWPGGVDVSFGQWQKLALARGFMRDAPLVLVLDEPTAALDAETEHALFARYAAAARERASQGAVTILVSHRFSTVRMADLIVVLDGSRVVETGSHDDLMARGGQYAELYALQASAYA
ncbi:MAG: ABC transporter ATP-binding protein [Vicinamibacterales bacterium]